MGLQWFPWAGLHALLGGVELGGEQVLWLATMTGDHLNHAYKADGPITTNEDFFLIYAFHLT